MKIKFYEELLRRVCEDPDVYCGLCWFINGMEDWCIKNNVEWANPHFYLKKVYPELAAYKPRRRNRWDQYWFPRTSEGWEKRIAILVEIIEKLKANEKMARRNSKKNNPKL